MMQKNDFYESLQSAVEAVHDVLLVIGDLNAPVGNNNTGRERVVGRHGTGTMNNIGERMCDQCEFNDLVIGGTIFQHKLIHKLTWKSSDGKTESQINHILINGKWRRSLQDVRTKRHADSGSDHSLVVAVLALKLRRAKVGEKRQKRFNIERLTDPDIN